MRNGLAACALVFAVTLAVMGAGCAPVASQAPDESPDSLLASVGAGYFQEYCASCHGVEARGDGPAAAALSPRPADLTRIAARRQGQFPSADIAKFIDGRFEVAAHGSRAMPIWGREFLPSGIEPGSADEIGRGRILTLVEYLRTIQEPQR